MKKILLAILILISAAACNKRIEDTNDAHLLQLEFYLEDVSPDDQVTIRSDDGGSSTYADLNLGKNTVTYSVARNGMRLWLCDRHGKVIASTYYQ